MKDYDAYLFDWDGTLACSHDVWLEIMHTQVKRYGLELTDQEMVDKLFGRYLEGLAELGVPAPDIPALKDELLAYGTENLPKSSMYPGSREVLELLSVRGRKLAVITASYRVCIDAAMAGKDLGDLFGVTVAGDEVKAHKPDPDGLFVALKALGIRPERAIMIGDSRKDILAGKNAGTDTILFHPPEHATQHDIEDLRRCEPTYIITNWQELLDKLQ